MTKFRILTGLLAFLLIAPGFVKGQKNLPSSEEKSVMAAKQVLMRVIGMKSEAFKFELIPSENGLDVYEVIALSGKVQVKGSSTIAMTRGAYDYLRKACNIQYTWSTDKITPPSSFPDLTIPRTVSPYKYRQYYNVCAYGYTNPFWKWEDWQKELDWMALHGINMPVAMAGQEAVWQKVFKDMGMTDAELRNYFVGPAFLPWQRMGNVNKHAGPLPQSYIDDSRDLQKQLILRMQQLGMEPIVPAFSGFVPAAYKHLYPDTRLLDVKGWCNFPDSCQSYLLPPGSSDFTNIGKKFIEEYQRTYGKVHYYLADLFNENEAPVSAATKQSELADFGKSVFDAINAGDPEGTWVMQGWLFYNNRQFWDKESVKALLSKVPNERMMIIDLANEEFHGWEQLDGFFGKPWIYSTIHNYGGNSQMIGNLPLYAKDAPEMLANPKKGKVVGFGLSPEGVQNNEVVYELLTDVAWSQKPIDIKAWLRNYMIQRYGAEDQELFTAWMDLLESVYSSPVVHPTNVYQHRPSTSPYTNITDSPAFGEAASLFLKKADSYMTNPRFRHDLVQVIVQFAGYKTDQLLTRAVRLHDAGQDAQSQVLFEKAQELLLMMDALTSSLPEQRLETWIADARKWGKTREESDYYEANAKRQVTMWGNSNTSVLFEYASKVWSGLIRDYYLNRWMHYAESLKTGSDPNFDNWEEAWISTPGLKTKAPVTGDLLAYARLLYNTAGQYSVQYGEQVKILPEYTGNNMSEISLIPAALNPSQLFTPAEATPAKRDKSSTKKKETTEKKTNAAEPVKEVKVFYTLDGTNPGMASLPGDKPVSVNLPASIKAQAFYDNEAFGDVASLDLPISFGKKVELNPAPSPKYIGRLGSTLTDAVKGSGDFYDGKWLGFEGESMNAVMDLLSPVKIHEIKVGILENVNSGIFSPSAISVQVSEDGKSFTTIYNYDFETRFWSSGSERKELKAVFQETPARFVRVILFNQGTCPAGSPLEGKKAWLFADEITVK